MGRRALDAGEIKMLLVDWGGEGGLGVERRRGAGATARFRACDDGSLPLPLPAPPAGRTSSG